MLLVQDNMNPKDTITVDVPLFIRLLEYAREDAKTDMDLHNVADNIIDLSEDGEVLTMDNYNAIVGTSEEEIAERRMLQVRAGILK
jgi:hypothetical protein